MIDTIIFDLGNVFIDLEKATFEKKLSEIGLLEYKNELKKIRYQYELGLISESEFFIGIHEFIPNIDYYIIRRAWNSLIGILPKERLEFLEKISTNYRLFLLANTDYTHADRIEFELKKEKQYYRFENCFEQMYYSHKLGMLKPDEAIFKYVIENNNLNPKNTLFVDDRLDNIESAKKVGLQTWHLQVGIDDVTELFEKNTNL